MGLRIIQSGDKTSHDVKPKFDTGRGYYWMKQMKDIEAAKNRGEYVPPWPRKPRRGPAEESFFAQVDRELSKKSFTVGISFDENGRIIR